MFNSIRRRLTTTHLPRTVCRWNKKGLVDPLPDREKSKKIPPHEIAELEEKELNECPEINKWGKVDKDTITFIP